jgi:hypothetical protein
VPMTVWESLRPVELDDFRRISHRAHKGPAGAVEYEAAACEAMDGASTTADGVSH